MKKNYATQFFGRARGDFSVSPQEYHRSWRNRVGAGRSFLGPWDYAGISSSGLKNNRGFQSPQEQPKSASVQRGGFISPANDLKITKQKIYKSGANRTQALSEE